MLKNIVRIFGGDPNKRVIEKFTGIVEQINALEPEFEKMSDDELRAQTDKFRAVVEKNVNGIDDPKEHEKAERTTLDELMPEAFATVREASKRTLGLRPYDVQLIGGITLHQGKIAEMRTGEGKTLVATLPLYLNALTGRGVHLVTVNDYLARRDARWMAPIYHLLGLRVGVLQMAARTENGKKAFIVDIERQSPHEDQHQLRLVDRQEAYTADIVYGTNSEFGFDYLRDNMTWSLAERVQRGYFYAIVDEVDNVLIDEARTPLIISGPAQDDTEWYVRMAQVVKRLRSEDCEVSERDRTVTLTEIGETHVEELLEMPLRDPERPEDVTPEQARLMGYLEQALRAQFLFKRNKDYLVQAGKVTIIDEFTGRLMPGRRWSDGLHQAVEAKEGARVQAENVTYATITIQNYFRMYQKLGGMTGTAITEAEEFDKIYKLEVLAIPTNLEYVASRADSNLVELDDRDDQGYKFRYYSRNDDPQHTPVFWKRKDYPDVIYRTAEAKFRAVTGEILKYFAMGRPMLVGTTSVELSDKLSTRLRAEPLRRLAQVLVLRETWLKHNKREEDGRQIPELQPINAPLDQLQAAELRKMATELNISLNPEDKTNLAELARYLGLQEGDQERLLTALKSGIPHQVLNARKHTEESQIIAGAGAFGAVTIATNMAGRGVDIKLGGELAEEIISAVNRVLRKAGYPDPYDMQMEERQTVLLNLDPSAYGIYDAEVKFFFQHLEEMEHVKSLGGLHVIGSERHEARRIDNQLRGRSARQGDPGSSRFYLSLEDDLMVRFGGQQANDMMDRLKVDDAMPIELGLVSRLVEQSQTRVEGSNFDIRKHLLEYDDVLNTQRTKIYEQRNLIFTKQDLSADVTEMLRTEVLARVPKALEDKEGPWQLLAWLDQVQPAFQISDTLAASYELRLIVDHLKERLEESSPATAVPSSEINLLLEVADGSMKAEEDHLLAAVETLLEQVEDRLEAQLRERQETVDTFFEGLGLDDETDSRQPRELADELSGLVHFPVRLSPEQVRALKSDPDSILPVVREQTEAVLVAQAVTRLLGAIERRFGESLEIEPGSLNLNDWNGMADQIRAACRAVLDHRRERFLGATSEGAIAKDLEAALAREKEPLTASDVELLTTSLHAALARTAGQPANSLQESLAQEVRDVLTKLEGSLTEEDRDLIVADVEKAIAACGNNPLEQDPVMQSMRDSIEEIQELSLERRLLRMLVMIPVGTQTSFDRKSHRRIQTRTVRLTYTFYAARFLGNRSPDAIAEDVLEHLEDAQALVRDAWGRSEWKRLLTIRPAEMDLASQEGLRLLLGKPTYDQVKDSPLQAIPYEYRDRVIDELGRRALTEVYRQLLLGVITELWVEYLTQMEALRVSIGLEAYGQRDPLVQYKSKAFELFQTLLSNMRLGVITRMFTYRPRYVGGAQPSAKRGKETEASSESETVLEQEEGSPVTETGANEYAGSEGDNKTEPEETGKTRPTQDAGAGKAAARPGASRSNESQTTISKKRRRGRR
jgi:preprotein translocase subunit SecA